MNASDDLSEPLGEAPEVGVLTTGEVVSALSRHAQMVGELRALHVRGPIHGEAYRECELDGHELLTPDVGTDLCATCEPVGFCCAHCSSDRVDPVVWPCETIRIVEQVTL